MKRALMIACTVLLLLAAVAGLGMWGWFHWAQHDVASRMSPPQLHLERREPVDIQVETLDGKQMHLADTKGKVVFLDLWGT